MDLNNKRVLIIKLSSIGDVFMNIAVVEQIKKSYPEVKLGWVVEKKSSNILKNYSSLDKLYILDKEKIDKLYERKKFIKLFKYIKKFIKNIKKDKWQIAIDLQWLFRSSFIPFMAGIPERYGCVTNGLHSIFLNKNRKIDHANYPRNVIKKNTKILTEFGFIKKNINPELFFPQSKEERKWAKKEINKYSGKYFIGIAPLSKWETKNWGLKNYEKLQEMIKENMDCDIFVFGGKSDKNDIRKITDKWDNVHDYSARISLNKFAAMLKYMDVFVSGDSSPMHIAASKNIMQIALFGPTSPDRTGPFNKKAVIIQKQYNCIPCFKKKCPLKTSKRKCMLDIKPEEIYYIIENYLEIKD
ncbi:MAG TPA: glycosyltransferase family 9 protein [Candidatus Mcinerneyibacterium sp.]|nr:glycosyltransferase family 9 protein [Candidatus Mcinerneyibacterium sp.]